MKGIPLIEELKFSITVGQLLFMSIVFIMFILFLVFPSKSVLTVSTKTMAKAKSALIAAIFMLEVSNVDAATKVNFTILAESETYFRNHALTGSKCEIL